MDIKQLQKIQEGIKNNTIPLAVDNGNAKRFLQSQKNYFPAKFIHIYILILLVSCVYSLFQLGWLGILYSIFLFVTTNSFYGCYAFVKTQRQAEKWIWIIYIGLLLMCAFNMINIILYLLSMLIYFLIEFCFSLCASKICSLISSDCNILKFCLENGIVYIPYNLN